MHKSQQTALFYGLATVLCWSTVATAFKLSLRHISPIQLVLVACVSSSVFLMTVLIIQQRLPELRSQSRRVYLTSFLFSLLNPTLYYILLFLAYDLLPAQEAQAINYSWAIVMTLLAVPLLGQKLHWFDLTAAAICYFGVCIIATGGELRSLSFSNFNGVVLAILSTIVWSLYWILNKKNKREPILALCLNFLFAIPIILLVAAIKNDLQINTLNWQGLAGGIYVGIFEMGLAFMLWLNAMKYAENTAQLANLIFLSPFLSLLFIWLILEERISTSTLIGLVLIIIGLLTQQKFSARNNSS